MYRLLMIIVATAGFKYDLCRLHTCYVVFDIYFPFQIVHWENLLVSQANPERMGFCRVFSGFTL